MDFAPGEQPVKYYNFMSDTYTKLYVQRVFAVKGRILSYNRIGRKTLQIWNCNWIERLAQHTC